MPRKRISKRQSTEVRKGGDADESSLRDSMVVHGKDGKIIRVNDRFEDVFGWTEDEIRGKPAQYLPKADKDRVMRTLKEALKGKPVQMEIKALTRDGRLLEAIATASAFRNAAGREVGLLVSIREAPAEGWLTTAASRTSGSREARPALSRKKVVSAGRTPEKVRPETKKKEEAPPRTEDTMGVLFDNPTIGVLILNLKGSLIEANKRFLDMFDSTDTQSARAADWSFLLPSEWRAWKPVQWKSIGARTFFADREVQFESATGKVASYLVSGGILRKSAKGDPYLYVQVVDATVVKKEDTEQRKSRKRLEAQLTHAKEQLKSQTQDLDKAKKQLARRRQDLVRVNDALKVLIKDFQEQKQDLEKRIIYNFQLTVEPVIEQLKSLGLTQAQSLLVDTLDFSIRHITSYFGINVSTREGKLSQREVQICQLISQGRNSREIAQATGLKYQTVIVHRKNIRKKLGIKKVKANLATFVKERLSL